MYIGVDVGGTTVKLGAFTSEGNIIKSWEIATDKSDNGKHILEAIAGEIRRLAIENVGDISCIAGIGIGVPGPVLKDGYVEVCVNLGWRDMYPARELSKMLGNALVKISNDANIAALGEAWKGSASGYKDVVLITLGTGVGGGVIKDGHIVAGSHGYAGELGHMHIYDDESDFCNCGSCGCLEQAASATGIVRLAKKAMAVSDIETSMRGFGDLLTAKDVIDCAKAGDKMAERVVDTACKYLGIAIANISYTIDPEVFVLGGGVSKAGKYLIDKINKEYKKYAMLTKEHSDIVLAKLGNAAGIYGGARMAMLD